MKRLLLFNLVTDADSPVQGFTTVWINALAAHCEYIDVLTMKMGRVAVADNVRVFSVGKEKGYSEPRRLAEFYRTLNRLLNERTYDACFVHMNSLFAILGAPMLKPRRIPITLWYAHGAVTPRLRLAEKVVDHAVTSSAAGFRLPSSKLQIIGQGIDTTMFTPAPTARDSDYPLTIISLSRLAPVKKVEIIIEAVDLLRQRDDLPDFRLRILGEAEPKYTAYKQSLIQLVRDRNLGDLIEFVGPVAYDRVVPELQAATIMVNTSQTGSVDKAVIEAMACGLPVITANEAFHTILHDWRDILLMPPDAPNVLAEKLAHILMMSAQERTQLGADLRQIVVRDHSLEHLIAQLLTVF